jgi:hypothetical protein
VKYVVCTIAGLGLIVAGMVAPLDATSAEPGG